MYTCILTSMHTHMCTIKVYSEQPDVQNYSPRWVTFEHCVLRFLLGLFFAVLQMEPRALNMLGKRHTMDTHLHIPKQVCNGKQDPHLVKKSSLH